MTKGARRMADIPADFLAVLNDGTAETRTLTEGLAIDFAHLMGTVYPQAECQRFNGGDRPGESHMGITRRMALAGQMILHHGGLEGLNRLMTHTSDTVRGWVAYGMAAYPHWDLAERLDRIRPLADDHHFGVREWAWLALRPHLLPCMDRAISMLEPWTAEDSANLRRFASEVTRPRGVWCSHSSFLRQTPQIGASLLTPLRADPQKYVQDSVANWLNDAGKDNPQWVLDITAQWQQESDTPATRRIIKRGLRSIPQPVAP